MLQRGSTQHEVGEELGVSHININGLRIVSTIMALLQDGILEVVKDQQRQVMTVIFFSEMSPG